MATSAAPDGYAIAQVPVTVFRYPFLQKTTFDPATDLTYILGVTGYTFGVVVKSDSPWKTFREFIADAKANPGTLNYGTPGAGTSLHLTMEQIAQMQGVKWNHIPFKGGAEVINALLGGHINADADSTSWAPQVNAGQLRLLVTWGATRTKNWPDVPTLRKSASTSSPTRRLESPARRESARASWPYCTTLSRRAWRKRPTSPR